MRSIKNAVLSFALVNIPVGVGSAASKSDEVTFRQLHVDCGHPIKSPRYCPTCDVNPEAEEVIRGYEFAKDQFVTISDEEYDTVRVDRSKVVRINKFVSEDAIPDEWFDKHYWLIPDKILGDAYSLLYSGLSISMKMGLGFTTLWEKEHICVVRCKAKGLMLTTLHPASVVKEPDYDIPDTTDEGVRMAMQLIEAWSMNVERDDLMPASNVALTNLVNAKVLGEEIVIPESKPAPSPPDLIEALRASIAERERVSA